MEERKSVKERSPVTLVELISDDVPFRMARGSPADLSLSISRHSEGRESLFARWLLLTAGIMVLACTRRYRVRTGIRCSSRCL